VKLWIRCWVLIGSCAIVQLVYGCADKEDGRIARTAEHLVDLGEPFWGYALSGRSTKDLQSPQLMAARVKYNELVFLQVHWVGDSPVADGILFCCPAAGFKTVIPIDPNQRRRNDVHASASVYFTAEFVWKKSEQEARILTDANTMYGCTVSLARGGAAISGRAKILNVR